MQRSTVSTRVLVAGLLATNLMVASCGDSGPSEPTPPAENVSISVEPTALSLKIDEAQQLTATVTGTTNTAVRWESSSTAIAVVTAAGLVFGRQAGGAIITARSVVDASKTAIATVTVTASNTDFVIDSVEAPAIGSIGGTIRVSAALRNQGSESTTTAFRVAFYYSTDATITTADIFSGFFCSYEEGLGVGAARRCAGPITVPASLPAGTYYMGAIADDQRRVDETSEGNNARAAPSATRIIAATMPDLVIDSVGAPATGTVGGTITAEATVRNQGLPTTTSFRVGFYYSTDPTISTSDVFSGTTCAYPTGMGANAADTCDGDVAVPSTLAPGTHYLGAIADDQARVTEEDEGNNLRAAPSTIVISGAAPDLVIEALTVPATATAGGPFTLSMTVRNQGGAAASGFRVGLHFSADTAITAADPFVASCTQSALAAGAAQTCSGTVTVLASFPAGTYHVGAIADDLAQVSESNEGNNLRAAPAPTVVSGNSPDLVVDALTAPTTGTAGGPITVGVTVRNRGPARSGPFRIGVYFSSDTIITTADAVSSNYCEIQDELRAGETDGCDGAVTIPATLAPGPYRVGAIVDDLQQVPESDEGNNARAAAAPIEVGAPRPDFVVELLTAPTTGRTGDSIAVTMRVRNVGATSQTPVRTGYYYSTDATITTTDVWAGSSCTHGALVANQASFCDFKIPVPGTLAPGTHYLGAITDLDEAVAEADEGNNTRAASNTTTITVGPLNLTIDGVYLSQSTQTYQGTVPLVAGRDAFLRVFVKGNRPDVATPDVRVRLYRNGMLAETHTISTGRAAPSVIDEGTLASSWNLLVPAALIQAGLSVLSDVDPGQQVAELSETDNTFPRNGSPQSIDVRAVPPFNVTLVPVLTSSNGQTGNVNTGNAASFVGDVMKMLPLVSYDATVRSPFTTNAGSLTMLSSWDQIITELGALRVADGATRHYYGVIAPASGTAACGMGTFGGLTALGMDGCDGLPAGRLAAHEWGHNFELGHALCGDVGGVDPDYPYGNARLGTYGIDVATQTLKLPDQNYDLMSYCDPAWVSDYHYRKVLSFRGLAATAPSVGESGPALLVWGRVEGGRMVLEPAFELTTRAALPEDDGPYRVQGLSADGRVVFSLAFAGRIAAGGSPDDRHFAFAVPITWAEGQVASLRLSGPRGDVVARAAPAAAAPLEGSAAAASRVAPDRATVRWNAAAFPMAIVRDGVTGEILSFARGGSVVVGTGGSEVELLLSDGVRSVVRRVGVAP